MLPPTVALIVVVTLAIATEPPTAMVPAEIPRAVTLACGVALAMTFTSAPLAVTEPPEICASTVLLMVAVATEP